MVWSSVAFVSFGCIRVLIAPDNPWIGLQGERAVFARYRAQRGAAAIQVGGVV